MNRISRLTTSSALALCIGAAPAFADLTAQQVWDDLEGYLQSFGYAVTATETPMSGGLKVTDVTMGMNLPEDEGSMSFSMSEVTLSENGDGTVSIEFPQSMPITMNITPATGEAANVVIDYTHDNLDMTVDGDESELRYTYSADALTLKLDGLTVDGAPITRDMARVDFVMNGVSGGSTTTYGDVREIAQTMTAESAKYDMAFNDPDSDDTAIVSGSMEALSFEGTSTLPNDFDPTNMAAMMAAGFAGDGTMSYANGAMQFAFTEDAGTTNGTTSTGSAAIKVAMDTEALLYDVSATDTKLDLSGPEIPLPVKVEMAQSALKVAVPVAASDTPQDFALGLTFGGFTMSELLWNIFDPGAILPRDPATVSVDLAGKVTPFVSVFDPEAMAQLEATGGAPGELNALTIQDLTVEAAGAKLTGIGDFTFDNTDLETFDGMPRPIGDVSLSLDGANGLIDKLIDMGLMSAEDAMGARMMMSMFAVPGDGEDSLNSKLEINEQGHIMANGMRIQ